MITLLKTTLHTVLALVLVNVLAHVPGGPRQACRIIIIITLQVYKSVNRSSKTLEEWSLKLWKSPRFFSDVLTRTLCYFIDSGYLEQTSNGNFSAQLFAAALSDF